MGLNLKQTANVLASANVEAAKASASIIAGNILVDKMYRMVEPKLPMMVRMAVQSSPDIAKIVLANAAAGALIKFAPYNEKAQLAANAMIQASMLKFAQSFNIEQTINELLEGVDLSALQTAAE